MVMRHNLPRPRRTFADRVEGFVRALVDFASVAVLMFVVYAAYWLYWHG